jgi:undecaprenyl-diphosphatase
MLSQPRDETAPGQLNARRQTQAPSGWPEASPEDALSGPSSQPPGTLRAELSNLDRAIYAAVASTATPKVDRALARFTSTADHSKLWMASAAGMAVLGGSTGRRAALRGLASAGLASLVVNQVFKNANRRRRPDRDGAAVPDARRVPMPTSTSFPSGHSASAFAFAEGISADMPLLGVPMRLAATLVAYSRVHAGVHYPGDVVAGSLIGMACGELAPILVTMAGSRLAAR